MPPTDLSLPLSSLSPEDRRAIAELIFRTWPKPEKNVAYRERQLQDIAASYDGPPELAPRALVVKDGAQIIANAIVEPRTIGTTAGDLTVLGLGKVCSNPDRRGEGLGARVVKAALGLVDRGLFPFALFQTSEQVRPFYERLGATTIQNEVINSRHADAHAHPFADEVVMRYPAGKDWPEGTIDLRGPGY